MVFTNSCEPRLAQRIGKLYENSLPPSLSLFGNSVTLHVFTNLLIVEGTFGEAHRKIVFVLATGHAHK